MTCQVAPCARAFPRLRSQVWPMWVVAPLPISAPAPGADIVEVGPHGLRRVQWADLERLGRWRRFLAPHTAVHHLLEV